MSEQGITLISNIWQCNLYWTVHKLLRIHKFLSCCHRSNARYE